MARTKSERGKKWLPDADYYRNLVAQAILFRRVEKIAREEAFPAYRANIVAYTVALLSLRFGADFGLSRIWRYQAVSDALGDAVTRLSPGRLWTDHRLGGRQERDRVVQEGRLLVAMQFLATEIADDFPEASQGGRSDASPVLGCCCLRPKTSGRAATVDDVLAMSRVMDVSAEIWQELARWGEATQLFTAAQVRLAIQLHESAESGWERTPTAALTKRASFLLDAAEKHIVSLDGFRFTDEDWAAQEPSVD